MERPLRSTTETPAEPDGGPGATAPEALSLPKSRPARAGKWFVALFGSAMILLAAAMGCALGLRPPRDRILPGVDVWGVDVGARTPREARAVLAERLLPALDRATPLVDGRRQWEATPRELGCSYDLDAAVEAARGIGRQGSLLRRVREGWNARRHGVALKPRAQVDREALRKRLQQVADVADTPARDAGIRFDGREFAISAERVGRMVDVDATEKNIVRYFAPLCHREVQLVVRDDPPQMTAAELEKIDGRLGTYTTRYNTGDVNRAENLRLAARALDGAVIPAGKVFSYNRIVGPRTEKRGYRVAKIFLKGEILDGVGGGICQVATTLYNAALESRMRILERARHSRPVTYVPPGRDATVSYDGVDLRFRNTTEAPILIQTQARGGVLTVDIYGKRPVRGAGNRPGAATRGIAGAKTPGTG